MENALIAPFRYSAFLADKMVDSSKLGKSVGQLDAQYAFGFFSDVAVPLDDNSKVSVQQDILQQSDAFCRSSDIKGTQLGKSV